MDLLLVDDQKVEPGWICGPEGLQQSNEVIRLKLEEGDGRMECRCFRSKELREMIALNPDLQKAPWFSSITCLNQDGFLLLLLYRIKEIRTGSIKTDFCVHKVSLGPVASLLFTTYQYPKNGNCPEILDELECILKQALGSNEHKAKDLYVTMFFGNFSKILFYGGKKHSTTATKAFNILGDYILGNDSACVPIFAHMNSQPVAPDMFNFVDKEAPKEFESSQVSKWQNTANKCNKHILEGPITRSRSKAYEALVLAKKQYVPGSSTKRESSGSEIPGSLSQSSHLTSSTLVTEMMKETYVAVDYLRTVNSSSSQTFKHTPPQDHTSRAGDASASVQNSQVSKVPESHSPCAASIDLHEKLRDTDIVNHSSKPSKPFGSGATLSQSSTSEGVSYNGRTTSYTSSSIPINSTPHTIDSASTDTPHTSIATTCTYTDIFFTNTSLIYTDPRTSQACTNTENMEPVQHPSKSTTATEIVSGLEKALLTPDASQHSGTSSSFAKSISCTGCRQSPNRTITFNKDQDTEYAIPQTRKAHCNSTCQHCNAVSSNSNLATTDSKLDDSSRAVTATHGSEISTWSQKDKPSISLLGDKTTTEAQVMISATLAEDAGGPNSAHAREDTPSSLGTKISTSEFIDRTTSSAAQDNIINKSVQNDRSTTSAQETKTAILVQGTKTATSLQDTNAITSAQGIKSANMPQGNKTANSFQDNKTYASDQALKTTNSAQDKETASYAQITKSVVPVQDTKTTSTKKKKNSSYAQNTNSIVPTQDTETTTSTKNRKTSSAQGTKSTSYKSAASSVAQADSTGHTSIQKLGGKPSGQPTCEPPLKGFATQKKFLEPLTPTSCCEAKDSKYGIRRKAFGTASTAAKSKTVLLLGAKGSGKTCLINTVANFILGIKSDLEKNLTVSDETVKTGGFRSTENINGYSFVVKEEEVEDIVVTLIDTPGLNDSLVNEVHDHMDSLKMFLANVAHKELEIHAIALVVQAHLVRLTSSEHLVMDHLKTLFGQAVSGHVVNLITFADNQSKPPVVEALDHYGISTRYCFKFNNSVFCGSSDESEKELDRAYWKTSLKSWKKCWKVVKDLGSLKTNAMKSIQKELYVTNMRDAATRKLQAEVKAYQKIIQAPYSSQVEEVRQRVWDMARVVLRTLQTMDLGNYHSLWSLIEDIVCHTCKEQAKEVTEFLLVGSPMHLKDAIIAILKGNYDLNCQLKDMERRAKDNFLYKTKNSTIKDILFKHSVDIHDAGAFPQANCIIMMNTAKAVSHLIRGQFSKAGSKRGVVMYLNSLEEEVEPSLHGFIKEVCKHIP